MSNTLDYVVGDPIYLGITTITPPSGSNTYYIHQQTLAMATWTITHSFNRIPDVTIIDNTGKVIYTDIEHPNNSTVVLTFSLPISGKALLV